MANVSLPLFQGGRRLARGAEERARLHELHQDRDKTRNLIELEVVEAFYALKSRREKHADSAPPRRCSPPAFGHGRRAV